MSENQDPQATRSDRTLSLVNLMQPIADAYHDDDIFRAKVDKDPREALFERGLKVPAGYEIKVVANERDLFHVVFPTDPNAELSDEALSVVSGGSTASSAGTASTIGTLITTVGSASSAGTASTLS